MQLKLTALEKREMEAHLKAAGVPKAHLAKITAITGEHYRAALERRKGPLARLIEKVTP